MKNKTEEIKTYFLNQMAGPLFRELAEDISAKWPYGELFTGHPDTKHYKQNGYLKIVSGPEYKRYSYVSRLFSWGKYWALAFFRYMVLDKDVFVLIVPQPPFLDFIAFLYKKIRKQKYAILIYDVYPDTLINFGPLKESGLMVKIWRRLNRWSWQNAEVVFTIGEKMAENIEEMFDSSKTVAGEVIVIPNWADVDWIKPLPKNENDFAIKYDQVNKLTVMYSGNMGQSHDIETIIETAKKLKENENINFLMIGGGAKKPLVEKAKIRDDLHNVTILGYQPQEDLPLSLTTADIAIITLDVGSEGLSVPSKTYYSMASGAALIGICDGNTEVAQTIIKHNCGVVITPGDTEAMVNSIMELLNNKERLSYYKTNSRNAAVKYFSRNNTNMYIDVLSLHINN